MSDCIVADSIDPKTIDLIGPRVTVVYNSPYDKNWTDEELCGNIIQLYCSKNNLTSLPDLPLCTTLSCYSNQLTSLPALPLCTMLSCYNNQLTSLSDLPLCTELYCFGNRLTSLSYLPLCTTLYCDVGMPFYDLSKWRKVWRTKELLLGRKYFTKWRVWVFAARKRDLHDELKYSPELPFYKNAIAEKLK